MIRLEDFDFHDRDPKDRTWTETLFLIFSVPEEAISGSVYTVSRPNLDVCHSCIEIHRGFRFHPWQIDHCDAQMHLPCPKAYSDFRLENGLNFKATSTRDMRWFYAALDGNCEFDLTFRGLCEPIDTHDPADNPLAQTSKVSGYDGWNNGHLEGTGRTTGTLRLGDRTYQVDCVDGINKSWGPRRDWGNRGATWVHVSLGDDLNAFMVFGLDFEAKEVVYRPFHYGFIQSGDSRRPIVAAELRADRLDMLVTRAAIAFEDGEGGSYNATGTTIAGAPWYNFNPSSAGYQTLMRWEGEGRIGYSHIADFAGLGALAKGMANRAGV